MLWKGNVCGKKSGNENLKATIPNTDYDTSETTRECGDFSYLGSLKINDARYTREIRTGLPRQKQH
jgi:hypothetical protein